jgi:hypothetical protein
MIKFSSSLSSKARIKIQLHDIQMLTPFKQFTLFASESPTFQAELVYSINFHAHLHYIT